MKNNLNSIGIDKKTKDTVVVVAMSGGVDSSTVAGLMKKEGYKVIGITLKLYDDTKQVSQSKQCCAGQDILDAKRVAHKLDIDHKILYYQNKFKEGVIDNFVESYLKGETPIPCVQCNQTVKFKDLFMEAKDLKADALITGHYVRSIFDGKKNEMYRAEDHNRDQSYFLFNTKRDQLNFLRFPLGNLLKDETREIAKKLNLNVADKPDSQDICFVPNGDYSSVIKKFEPKAFVKGNIKNIEGKVIGVHDGIVNFTIGQRRGIKVSDKDPLYVLEINPKMNEIIVGPNKLTGEWGQNPIPGPMDDYEKSIKRHCGRIGAIEVFLSGPGLENHFEFMSESKKTSREIVSLYEENDPIATEVMDIYFERIARSFSTFVNILDPDIIVCGGGMSEIDDIYSCLLYTSPSPRDS